MDGNVPSALLGCIEAIIKSDKNHYDRLNTGRKSSDFILGDIVKCTYLKGFYKVAGYFKDKIQVQPIEITDEFIEIDPSFLKKIEEESVDSVKILYSEKLT